jgi:hypothetical protein
MFDASNKAFLPEFEFLIDTSRAKTCRKHSFRKKFFERHIEAACIEQNELRRKLKQELPNEVRHIEDNHFGVDYEYRKIKIDQKFSFGALGKNTIKIRVNNRNLINNSDWTMIINEEHKLEFFPTKKLALFVKKNWGIVQKRLVERKGNYTEYAVKLEELYKLEKLQPIYGEINYTNIIDTFKRLELETNLINSEEVLSLNQTVIDNSKMICFEPQIAIIARQLFRAKN